VLEGGKKGGGRDLLMGQVSAQDNWVLRLAEELGQGRDRMEAIFILRFGETEGGDLKSHPSQIGRRKTASESSANK